MVMVIVIVIVTVVVVVMIIEKSHAVLKNKLCIINYTIGNCFFAHHFYLFTAYVTAIIAISNIIITSQEREVAIIVVIHDVQSFWLNLKIFSFLLSISGARVYVCVCMCVCMCVYVCVCMYVYVCVL